jgi:hypothetical protein
VTLADSRLDAGPRGLALRDRAGRWRLRAGDIRPELLYDAARRDDRSAFRDLARTGPVWGVRWEVRF